MRIAYLGPWNAICGVSEVGRCLVEQLEKLDHHVEIFANNWGGDYHPTGFGSDQPHKIYRIFDTGFMGTSEFDFKTFLNQTLDCDVLLINYQDYLFPNKYQLNDCIYSFKAKGKKVAVWLHDNCLSPRLDLQAVTYIIAPPSLTDLGSMGSKLHYIDQGIPEFTDRQLNAMSKETEPRKRREGVYTDNDISEGCISYKAGEEVGILSGGQPFYFGHRSLDPAPPRTGCSGKQLRADSCFSSWQSWRIASFGMGRNKNLDLIEIVAELNKKVFHPSQSHHPSQSQSQSQSHHPSQRVELFLYVAKPDQAEQYKDIDHVTVVEGYLPAATLAAALHVADATIIWYPNITAQSTSSAFRFAVGSQVPIISNNSNWIADMAFNGCYIDTGADSKEAYLNTIADLFNIQTYSLKREQITILQKQLTSCIGWSKIAKQYIELIK